MDRVTRLTAPGAGGVAVLRIVGARAHAALTALAGGRTVARGEVRLVRLRGEASDQGGAASAAEDLDEALLVGLPPVAGAEVTELHLHGSPPLVAEVLRQLSGAAPEAPASLEERAEAAWVDVPTELGARVLVAAWRGLRPALEALAVAQPAERAAGLAALVAASDALAPLFRPLRVVLVGPVNAGKSTLFNTLAGEARAIVSPEPGTTRDALGTDVPLGPYAMRLVDTAGEREAPAVESVERAGQALARSLAASADAVVALARAPGGPVMSPGGPPVLRLSTAADLAFGPDPERWPAAAISAEVAPAHAVNRVTRGLLDVLGLSEQPLWRPGTPVLWDPLDRDTARRATAGDDAARRAWLELMLGGEPHPPSLATLSP